MEPESTQVTEQPSADSVTEDRIASIFGGGDPEPAEPTEAASETEAPEGAEPPAEEMFELELEGEKFTLPKKLEKSFLQERDYTQKAQSLAEQRRTFELQQHQQRISQMSQQFHAEVAQEQQQLQMLDAVLKQARATDMSQLSLEDLIRKRADIENLTERRSQLNEMIEGKRKEWGEKQQQEIAKLRAQSLETISKRIPGWTDATAKAIREHALSEGYSETELNSILDPRHVTTLWKAQQFDLLKSRATSAVTTAKNPKTTPSNPMPPRVREDLNFRKVAQKANTDKAYAKSSEFASALESRIARKFGG
jgi:hypothetical protein